jgi:hypothetical protein
MKVHLILIFVMGLSFGQLIEAQGTSSSGGYAYNAVTDGGAQPMG